MATDYALLRRAQEGEAYLRVYRWDPPCLSFGRNETVTRRYDLVAIRERDIQTVRRPTGGRAVWHDTEVTYSVAAPIEVFGSLQRTYQDIHLMLAGALAKLGIRTDLAPRPRHTPGPGAGACFATPIGGEVLAEGQKLVGSAQIREGDSFLQHGSILLENRQDLVSELTLGEVPETDATSLSDLLDRPIHYEPVADCIATTAQATWEGEWTSTPRPDPGPYEERFRDPAWTLRR